LDQALAQEPAHKDALFYRGMSLLRLDRPDPAMADFVRALELDSNYAPPHAGRAEVLIRRRALDEAEAAVDRALALEPRLAEGWYARGLMLGTRGDAGRAIEAFQEALAIDSGHAYSHYQLGLAYNQTGRPDLAIAHLEKFLDLAPRAPEAPRVRELLNTLRKGPRPGTRPRPVGPR
jgi:tetratricopeptide (TPR) repeat protein